MSHQYQVDTTRWLRFKKAAAEDCTMSLLEEIEPQYVFTVVQECEPSITIEEIEKQISAGSTEMPEQVSYSNPSIVPAEFYTVGDTSATFINVEK